MFRAVMSMRERNAGQVRGPVQLTFSRSIDPILAMDLTIARVALQNRGERQAENEDNDQEAPTHGTLARKSTVSYGIYQGYGFFNPHFAKHTCVDSAALELLAWRLGALSCLCSPVTIMKARSPREWGAPRPVATWRFPHFRCC